MPKKTAPRYGIAYGWTKGEGPWNTDMDANLKLVDSIIGGSVISDTLTTPPASPTAGDSYIIATGGTGAWAGKDKQIATYIDSAWLYIVPKRGLRVEVQSASGFKYYNGTAWTVEPSSGGGGSTTLAALTDVDVTTTAPTDGQLLTWNQTDGKWENKDAATSGGGATALSALTDVDVTTTAPTNGQVLTWNDTANKWENQTATGGGISDAPSDGSEYARKDGAWVPVTGGSTTLATLTDVDVTTTTPTDGQVLTWNNAASKWENKDAATGGSTTSSYPEDQTGFIDGNFDSWQVGTSFTLAAATDTYTADMWVCNAGTGGAATVSRQVMGLGNEKSYMTRPRKYRLKHSQTTAASTNPTIGQKLEGVGQYSGKSITISGSFMADSIGTYIVGVRATQHFGTGGVPSSDVVTSKAVTFALSDVEARFSVRLDIPSLLGMTLGANGDDYLRIDFLLATGENYGVYASQLQIDLCDSTSSSDTTGNGGAPQPFRWRGLPTELFKVLRHVQVYSIPANQTFLVGVVATSSEGFGSTFLPASMRAAFAGSVLIGTLSWIGGGLTGASTITVAASVMKMITIYATGGTGGSVGLGGYFGAGASGAVILLDARL